MLNAATPIRPPRRFKSNLPRKSRFRVGQFVRVESEYNGDYFGLVTETHDAIKLYTDVMQPNHTETKPGVTVLVTRWEGCRRSELPGEEMVICAHDDITSLHDGDFTRHVRDRFWSYEQENPGSMRAIAKGWANHIGYSLGENPFSFEFCKNLVYWFFCTGRQDFLSYEIEEL